MGRRVRHDSIAGNRGRRKLHIKGRDPTATPLLCWMAGGGIKKGCQVGDWWDRLLLEGQSPFMSTCTMMPLMDLITKKLLNNFKRPFPLTEWRTVNKRNTCLKPTSPKTNTYAMQLFYHLSIFIILMNKQRSRFFKPIGAINVLAAS